MKGFLIDGESQSIQAIEVNSPADIVELIGYDSVISDDIDDTNAIYFDEDCFIRGTPGRFRIDRLAPVAGRAVVIGKGGKGLVVDSSLDLNQLKSRVTFT